MDEQTRDELLIRMDERVSQLVKEVMGNGRPGLVSRMATQEEATRQLRTDMEQYTQEQVATVKAETPGKGGQRFAQVTAAVAFVVAVWQGLQGVLKG